MTLIIGMTEMTVKITKITDLITEVCEKMTLIIGITELTEKWPKGLKFHWNDWNV